MALQKRLTGTGTGPDGPVFESDSWYVIPVREYKPADFADVYWILGNSSGSLSFWQLANLFRGRPDHLTARLKRA